MSTKATTGDGVTLTTERHDRTMFLPCRLTDDELREAGDELASVTQQIGEQEAVEKRAKAELKARKEELIARQNSLALRVSRREESRDVACLVTIDYAAGRHTTVRTDTGEVVAERPLRDDERQPSLPGA